MVSGPKSVSGRDRIDNANRAYWWSFGCPAMKVSCDPRASRWFGRSAARATLRLTTGPFRLRPVTSSRCRNAVVAMCRHRSLDRSDERGRIIRSDADPRRVLCPFDRDADRDLAGQL